MDVLRANLASCFRVSTLALLIATSSAQNTTETMNTNGCGEWSALEYITLTKFTDTSALPSVMMWGCDMDKVPGLNNESARFEPWYVSYEIAFTQIDSQDKLDIYITDGEECQKHPKLDPTFTHKTSHFWNDVPRVKSYDNGPFLYDASTCILVTCDNPVDSTEDCGLFSVTYKFYPASQVASTKSSATRLSIVSSRKWWGFSPYFSVLFFFSTVLCRLV
mmetsp:Transcript_22180/g.37017  ORF Transcript_22180/g.37017 Transcript_22180/m.37017 type:complete len:220 (+) Transcript_22180:164-823(+)